METLWAGRIFTPKRPIASMDYWIGLTHTTCVLTSFLMTSLNLYDTVQRRRFFILIGGPNDRYIWGRIFSWGWEIVAITPISFFFLGFRPLYFAKKSWSFFQKKIAKNYKKSPNIGGDYPRTSGLGGRVPRAPPHVQPLYWRQAEFRNFIKCHKLNAKIL